MHVTPYVWAITIAVTVAFLIVDVFVIGRRPHEPSTGESARHLAFYLGSAVAFGLGVLAVSGAGFAGEFYAGWLTEYSLSVDNLFVFIVIMSKLSVPKQYQQTALLVGIVLALVMRGAFIALGAAAIHKFSWVFYVFGAFLIYTAVKLARQGASGTEDYRENAVMRWTRKHLPASEEYHGVRLTVVQAGKRLITPMAIVIVALGTTDLLFALDSIPAIYGLTEEPYLVFAANVFALMGLRQLYFLIGTLLTRLVYLGAGLSVLLGFIGVKLVLHALHDNRLPFLNGGQRVEWAPDIPTWVSLVAIVLILGTTTVASLVKSGGLAPAPEHG
jgi:tellurite resistance protein TerC